MSGIRTRAIEIVSVFEMEFRSEKGMSHHKQKIEQFFTHEQSLYICIKMNAIIERGF